MKKMRRIGMVIAVIGLTMGVFWYGWKLALVLMVFATGNNIEQRYKD